MKQTTKIKKDMGKNTTLFIQGKRTKTHYRQRDEQLHGRLYKELNKKGKK